MHARSAARSPLSRLAGGFRDRMAVPVDGASLAVFRIAFGLVVAWHAVKQIWTPERGISPADYWFDKAAWNFPYPGFEWVVPWPEPWLTLHFVAVAGAGLLLAAGFCYRLAAVSLFFLYTYTFLLEQSDYNNHYYLMCLIQFLLIWMPAQARFSVDAWWKARQRRPPVTDGPIIIAAESSSEAPPPGLIIPFWPVFLLRAQLFLVYFYGGVAKVNADWLTGVPLLSPGTRLRDFLVHSVGLPETLSVSHVCLFLAWTGLVYDLSIGFLLLSARTRLLAIVLTAIFHGTNSFLFQIGVFPPMAFAATMIFFPPDWPARFWSWLKRPRLARPDLRWLAFGAIFLPGVGAALGWGRRRARHPVSPLRPIRGMVPMFVAGWILVQILFPLRHFFIAGDANWTEEGQHFAWRMMLRAKAAGHVLFTITDHGLQAAGESAIEWSRWPADQPRAVYVSVDSAQFIWKHHPGLNSIYEPMLGERLVYALPSSAAETIADCSRRIARTWRETFGREPHIRRTVGLLTVFEGIEGDLRREGAVAEKVLERVAALTRIIAEWPEGGTIDPRNLVGLADELERLVQCDYGPLVLRHLRRIHPFAIQGAAFVGEDFLIVDDEPGLAGRHSPAGRLSGGEPYVVWVDLSRLRPDGWRGLPLSFVAHDSGSLKVYWNHFHELNRIQMERMSVRPVMIRQYARRIASLWESQTGRRPEVQVKSHVMLNYRDPHYLIDPEVDLAAVPYSVLEHNSWILPHEKRPRSAGARVATRANAEGH